MSRYAQVIIDISHGRLDHPFTYRIPEALRPAVRLGSLVNVPFGKGSTSREGYVVAFSDTADYPDEKIKEITGVAAKGSSRTGDSMVQLAAWMKERYGSTMVTALRTTLTARKEAKPVEKREVRLLLDEASAREKLSFYEGKHQVARARLLRELMEIPTQPYSLILSKLHVTAATMRAMKEQGVIEILTTTSLRNPVSLSNVEGNLLHLSKGQQAIVDGVIRDFDAITAARAAGSETGVPLVSLIHGITGSGKTEVYIRIIEEIVKRGRQAIMLIPEISLTYQTLIRFYRHFGDRVSVMNSTLSEGEKSDQFERARRGEIDVIIGPRSALFTPFPNPGVIVIDEEHENSYKNESMPKYHARDVAVEIAKIHGGVVVLGSATPSLDSAYHAKRGDFRLYELGERLTGGSLPDVDITDMRSELRSGNRSILSRKLSALLEDRLAKKEQTMLFLNRRGFSGFVSCRSCGHVMKCPHCDVALSLHRNGKLICHYCGYETPNVHICPECGSKFISGFRAGTEQIEEEIHRRYPAARILRMDADTTAQKGSYEKILSSFANEEADILLGTQMIVKGHDFPGVTLVGILLADLSLYSNDYRASERTFQLLTQAAGRAGRGEKPGHVVIQTYEPEHYAIQYASRQDYEGFYNEEIAYRNALMYPPVYHMLAVQIQSRNDDYAQMMAGRVRELLDKITKGINAHAGTIPLVLIIGPAAASIWRIRDEYRYVVYIKCAKYDTLVDCKDRVEAYASAVQENVHGAAIQVQFDFDPMNPY
ncbi:replication restart DNA helicase PriA [Lachnospiraceae bacterium NK3A20]|nr:replication restart DNA helicase PriA [Lachnospiraceae bacterium NK3A20]